MFTVEYRVRENKGRQYSKWHKASEHELPSEARQAFAQHIAEFWTFDLRLIDQHNGKTLANYKYSQLER